MTKPKHSALKAILLFSIIFQSYCSYNWLYTYQNDKTEENWHNAQANLTTCGTYSKIVSLPYSSTYSDVWIQKGFLLGGMYSDLIISFNLIGQDVANGFRLQISINGEAYHNQIIDKSAYDGQDICNSAANDFVIAKKLHLQLRCKIDYADVKIYALGSSMNVGISDFSIAGVDRCPDGCLCCGQTPYQDKCFQCDTKSPLNAHCNTNGLYPTENLPDREDGTIKYTPSTLTTSKYNTAAIWFRHEVRHMHIYLNNVEKPTMFNNYNSGFYDKVKDFYQSFVVFEFAEPLDTVKLDFMNDRNGNQTIQDIKMITWNRCTHADCEQCLPFPAADKCIKCTTTTNGCSELAAIHDSNPSLGTTWGQSSSDFVFCGATKVYYGKSGSFMTKEISFNPQKYTDFVLQFDFNQIDTASSAHEINIIVNEKVVLDTYNSFSRLNDDPNTCGGSSNDRLGKLLLTHSEDCKTDTLTILITSNTVSAFYSVLNLKIYGYTRCDDTACDCCYQPPHTDICQIKSGNPVNSLSSTKVTVPVTSWKHWMSEKQSPSISCGGTAIAGSDSETSYGIKTLVSLPSEVSDILFEFQWIDLMNTKAFFQIYVNSNMIRFDYYYAHKARGTSCAGIQPIQNHRALITYHSPFKTDKYDIMIKYYSDQVGIQELNLYTRETCKSDANGCIAPLTNAASNKGRTTFCSAGQGINDGTGNCQSCTATDCKSCRNHNFCESCQNSKLLKVSGSTSTCISNDCGGDTNYFANTFLQKCVLKSQCSVAKCFSDSCTGETCTKCMDNAILHEGQCIDNCPDGQFRKENTCVTCQVDNCKTCSTSYDTCSVCDSGYYKYSSQRISCVKCSTRDSREECKDNDSDNNTDSKNESSGPSGLMIGGIIVGVLVLLGLFICGIIRNAKNKLKNNPFYQTSAKKQTPTLDVSEEPSRQELKIHTDPPIPQNNISDISIIQEDEPPKPDNIQAKELDQQQQLTNRETNNGNQQQPIQINLIMDPNTMGMNAQNAQYVQDPYGMGAYQQQYYDQMQMQQQQQQQQQQFYQQQPLYMQEYPQQQFYQQQGYYQQGLGFQNGIYQQVIPDAQMQQQQQQQNGNGTQR